MARKSESHDQPETNASGSRDEVQRTSNVQADHGSVAIGGVNIGGDLSGSFTVGYTAEQVSLLLTQITSNFQPKAFDGRCPYKGLEVFEEEDAELFFGRERLVEDLVKRVRESRTVFITGPSGSGKSSLVRAGLIHALKQGVIQDLHSERWLYEIMKPGREPIKDLSLAFSRLKSPELADYFQAHAGEAEVLNKCAESVLSGNRDQRMVLFLDQFEEVFTQVTQEEERLAFINMLAHAGTVRNGRVIVLFAMRSDFVSNCATYPALNELLSQEFRQIGAMQPEELVAAIALPARHVGLPIEDELIARIINDMKGEPGALPLMQFALKDLFDSQQEKGGVVALTLKDYLQHGGIHKSLERHADKSFAELSESEQGLARSIFSGLIEIGRGTQDTRRTALFDELVPATASMTDVEAIVRKLADARLVITDEQAGKDTVTISHEKLIDAWPWLKKLVNENRDVIALQNEIASDAKEWEDHRRDPSYLYTGGRLANAREQLETQKLVLSGLAQEFVIAGQARQRHSQRIRIIGFAIPLGLVILAIILVFYLSATSSANLAQQSGYFANTQQASASTSDALAAIAQANADEAQRQLKISRASELAAQSISLRDKNFQVSLLLGIEGFRLLDLVQTRGALLDATNANPQLLQFLPGHTGPVRSVAFSPDGKLLASGSADHTIILWDLETRKPSGQPLAGHAGPVSSVAFSPNGKLLASGSDDHTIILWDLATRQPIGQPLAQNTDVVPSVTFSPDGKILASSSWDGTVILWDISTQKPIGLPFRAPGDAVLTIAFSPDGKMLAIANGDDTITLWDMATQQPIGEPLDKHRDGVLSLAFSPDGRTLASDSWDSTIILWDIETHQAIDQLPTGQITYVGSLAFHPSGAIFASVNRNKIFLWDAETHQAIGQPLTGHAGSVNSVAFSPDGTILASGSDDGMVALWDTSTSIYPDELAVPPIGQSLTDIGSNVYSVAFSPDGKTFASADASRTILLWDPKTRQSTGRPLAGLKVAFSPDGKLLASDGSDGDNYTVILWNTETYQPVGQPLTGHEDYVEAIAFSPDGRLLASSSYDKTIILWDVETQQPIGEPLRQPTDPASSVAFSPDSKILASGNYDNTITLWDVETQQPIGQPLRQHTGPVNSVAFSADGKILASGSDDGTIILWNIETDPPIGQVLSGHTSFVKNVAFSPDGKMLASGSDDLTIILWDVKTRQPIGQPLAGHTDTIWSVAFSPDGQTLASGSHDTTVILWDLRPEFWIEQSCRRAGRNLTRAEWERYFQAEDYRQTCEQWSLEQPPSITSTPTR